jgi:hypothetical protein
VVAEITIKLKEVHDQFIFSHLQPTRILLTRNQKQTTIRQ